MTDSAGGKWKTTLNAIEWRTTGCGVWQYQGKGTLLIAKFTIEILQGPATPSPWSSIVAYNTQNEYAEQFFTSECAPNPFVSLEPNLPTGFVQSGSFAFDITGPKAATIYYDVRMFVHAASWKVSG